ncbi:MAG: M48 family metalloprotease [Acidimicrobiales bacterium]
MYELIAHNRRMTWLLLVVSFVLLVVVAGAVAISLQAGIAGVVVGVVIAGFMTFGAYWKSDAVAIAATRAQPASIEEFPQLHNLVEGMSIAAGIPKPRVYVVHDPAPNAFATGRDPDNAAIAVTTGLMQVMNRTELEGVIAHELAHIRNYDIRVTTIAVATAGAIAIICDIFWRLLWFGGGRGRGNSNSGPNPIALIGIIAVVVLAPLAAGLIRAAVSRKREALADATAVELTRYPTGLRQALEKLASNTAVVHHASHATAHLWIESPLDREDGHEQARLNGLFNTHPPLSERINTLRALEGLPPWEGPTRSTTTPAPAPPPTQSTARRGAIPGMPGGAGPLGGMGMGMGGAGGGRRRSPAEIPQPPRDDSGPAAGWYPDPAGNAALVRYWDGQAWTDQVRSR